VNFKVKTQSKKQSKIDWILFASILVLNFVLKIIFIDVPEIGGDEPFTLFYANADLEFFFDILKHENNPPLFTLLLKGWISIFGDSVLSVRFLPLIFSTLTAGIIYQLGRNFYSRRIGILAALTFTFANYHIYFAHEARPYALFGLLTVLSMNSFFKIVVWDQKKQLLVLAAINAFLIYNHFFGFFVLFIQGICFLSISNFRSTSFKHLFISWGLTILAYIPYLPILWTRFSESTGGTWVEQPTANALYSNIRKFSNEPVVAVLFLALLFAALLLSIIKKRESKGIGAKPLILWFFVPYLLMFALSFKMPMFLDRYLVYLSFGFYFLVAYTVDYLFRNRPLKLIVSGATIVLMLITTNLKSGNERDNKSVIEFLHTDRKNESIVIICPDWHKLLFSYHYNQEYFKSYQSIDDQLNGSGIYPAKNINDIPTEIMSKAETIYYYDGWSELVDPDRTIHKEIEKYYELKEVIDNNNDFRLFVYSTN
jgi:hypothetical protein